MLLRRVPIGVVTFLLWLVTALVGLWEIVILRDMVFRIYVRLVGSTTSHDSKYWLSVSLGNWVVLFLSLAWLGLIIGTGEYHYKRAGQRASWRLFGWTIGGELLILLLALII